MFEGKLTLPVLFVLNNGAGEEIKRLAIKVKQRLASHQEISDLVSFTKDNGGILYAQKEMTKYKEKALDLLSLMPDTEVKESLRLYLDYVVDRHK
jgi:octaprenyl-diphosphate synthase